MHDTTVCVDDGITTCINTLSDLFYPNLEETEDLGAHINFLEASGKMILRQTLIENLKTFDSRLMAERPKTWKNIGRFKRTLLTLLGTITYVRRCYKDECGNRHYLLDEVLGIPPLVRIEPSTFLWLVLKSADVSYEKTAKAYYAHTSTTITRQTVMRCVHKAGALLAEVEAIESGERPISSSTVFIEFDGFHVNLQTQTKAVPALPRYTYKEQFKKKSKEMKVWVAYGGINKHRRVGCVHWASDSAPSDFFDEGLIRTFSAYDIDDVDYVICGSDAANWCKAHGIDENLHGGPEVISELDRFHINQKVMRAFSDEEDRSEYFSYLYGRDFEGFFAALASRMELEPDDPKSPQRQDLWNYIKSNLDWLESPSLTRSLREKLASQIPLVFGDRPFAVYLTELLLKRRYKRFLRALREIVAKAQDDLKDDYRSFLKGAEDCVAKIKQYHTMRLGTMEGTNAKVYAARLKVWGCAWSEKGALAMMRIRARIASRLPLIAPGYDGWMSEAELTRIKKWRERMVFVPETSGSGYEPPRGSIVGSDSYAPKQHGIVSALSY